MSANAITPRDSRRRRRKKRRMLDGREVYWYISSTLSKFYLTISSPTVMPLFPYAFCLMLTSKPVASPAKPIASPAISLIGSSAHSGLSQDMS